MKFCSTSLICWFFFFFNDTATTEIYTLSLHDALPILSIVQLKFLFHLLNNKRSTLLVLLYTLTIRSESTRLNSSHANISYAVFCLKKKKCSSTHILQRHSGGGRRLYNQTHRNFGPTGS